MKRVLTVLLALACLLAVLTAGAAAEGEERWEVVAVIGDVATYTAEDLVKGNDGLWFACEIPSVNMADIVSLENVDGVPMMAIQLPQSSGYYIHSHHGMYPNVVDYTQYNAGYMRIRVKNGEEALSLLPRLGNNTGETAGYILFTDMWTEDLTGEEVSYSAGYNIEIESNFDGWVYISLDPDTFLSGGGSEDMLDPATWTGLFNMVYWFTAIDDDEFVNNTICFGNIELVNNNEPEPLVVDPTLPQILMGTPVLDGALDELYKSSIAVTVGPTFYQHNGAKASDSAVTAKTYLLHDGVKLYLCTVVENDAHVLNTGIADWINDSVEHYLKIGKKDYSLSVTADGTVFKNSGEADLSVKAVKNENGWVIEVAVPYDKSVAVDATYGLQINDLIDADAQKVVAYGVQTAETKYALSEKKAAVVATPTPAPTPTPTPVPATEAPTEAPTQAPTDAPATATPAPAAQDGNLTWLYIVIGAVVIAAIVVAIVLGKKKK